MNEPITADVDGRNGIDLHPQSFYVHALKPTMPRSWFEPARSRLAWLVIHLAVIVMATIAITVDWMPWPVIPALSLVIGLSFAGMTFLGHETLHGGVVRGRLAWMKPIVGWICFAPFTLSQQLWVVWHNRVHHANTHASAPIPTCIRRSRRIARTHSIDSRSTTSRSVDGDGEAS